MKPIKNESIAGLDIGSYSVKCVQVAQAEGGIELQRASITPLSQESDVKKILEKLDLSQLGHVRVALSGPSVIIRRISMPLLSPRELQGAIRFEAESHIPFSIDDCVLDYQVLKQDAVAKEMSILLVAAKRDLVESRYKLLTEAGIYPEVMDLDIFCLVNAFEMLSPELQKNYGLLNIGHKNSSFVIVNEALPAFVREISFGGAGVTRALADIKSVNEAQADEMKTKKPAAEAESLKLATQKGFELLSEEIRHSVDYVENEIKEELKNIYVSGGGALAAEAVAILGEEIGRPVALWDNTKKIKLAPGVDGKFVADHAAELTVALGMALRGTGAAKK